MFAYTLTVMLPSASVLRTMQDNRPSHIARCAVGYTISVVKYVHYDVHKTLSNTLCSRITDMINTWLYFQLKRIDPRGKTEISGSILLSREIAKTKFFPLKISYGNYALSPEQTIIVSKLRDLLRLGGRKIANSQTSG